MSNNLAIDGYEVLDNLIDEDLIAQIDAECRKVIQSYGVSYDGGTVVPNAFHVSNVLNKILPSLSLEDFFGVSKKSIYLTSHVDIHRNKGTGWHKDRPEVDLFLGANKDNYNVYKIAIYLTNSGRGGHVEPVLSVIPGSHKQSKLHPVGKSEAVIHLKKGEVLAFDLRLSHKGRELSVIEKVLKRFVSSSLFSNIHDFFLKKIDSERLALFFTVAVTENGQLDYLDRHMTEVSLRQNRQVGSDANQSSLYEINKNSIVEMGYSFYV